MNFTISGGSAGAKITTTEREEQGVLYVDIHMELPAAAIPEEFSLRWYTPITAVYSIWAPGMHGMRNLPPQWSPAATDSRLASWMPVQALLSGDGKNRLTIALSDAFTPAGISTGVVEETACMECTVRLFTLPTAPVTENAVTLRLDPRPIDWCDAIRAVADWWQTECGYTPASVPEHARLPMNSLWYSFHQRLEPAAIVEQCRLSRPYGMETVIVDDGWQTLDSGRGYAYCGDWQPERLSDMRGLVDAVHATGMKLMLWYSVPFVGIYSKKYQEFKDMVLDQPHDGGKTWALDPRYRQVREYLVDVYTRAVKEWDLDGLKLDFIDSFALHGRSLEPDPRRDFSSLEQAVDALMQAVTDGLRAIRPDILIEFRQSYVGPAIRKYGNMRRVGDCPADPQVNRRNIVDLRLTSGETAVHSDMLMWNRAETPENVARQLATVLYAVPQISVLLDTLPEAHQAVLKYYLDFWRQYRGVLLDGRLWARHPEACYSQVGAEKDDLSIVTVYTDPVLHCGESKLIAVNAGVYGQLILKNAVGRRWRVLDCTGAVVAAGTAESSLAEIAVPVGGMLFVE